MQRNTFYSADKVNIIDFDIHLPNSEVFCKVFKDKQSCISFAEWNFLSPRTKDISIKHHKSQRFVQKKKVRICCNDRTEQTSDICTKPFDKALFIYLKRKLSGW